jgi:hypothetical protein
MRFNWALALVILLVIIPAALAVPSTPTITLIGSNNFTAASTGGSGTCWFRWGVNPVTPEWTTPNQTLCSGAFSALQYGSPYYPNIAYNVKACDDSGCSAAATFVSASTTPLPQTTYGVAYDNITQNGFNVMFIITALPQPYFWAFPTVSYQWALTVFCGLLFAIYILGLWLRQRKSGLALLVALMVMPFFVLASAGFNWGIPGVLLILGELLTSAIIASMILTLMKKG